MTAILITKLTYNYERNFSKSFILVKHNLTFFLKIAVALSKCRTLQLENRKVFVNKFLEGIDICLHLMHKLCLSNIQIRGLFKSCLYT